MQNLFTKASKLYQELEKSSLASSDQKYQDRLTECIDLFDKCHSLSKSSCTFSPNEELEDINTGDLRYLLLPAYIGFSVIQQTSSNPNERILILEKARNFLYEFMESCEQKKALNQSDMQAWITMIGERTNTLEERVTSRTPSHPLLTRNAEDKRATKIERFKRQKDLDAKIAVLQEQIFKSQSDDECIDEDLDRSYLLLLLELFVLKSFDSLQSIAEELEILQSFVKGPLKPERPKQNPNVTKFTKPFVLTTREHIAKGVFRPGHNLPTMTIDEYLEIEKERGNIISGGGKMPEERVIDWDNDEEADKETMKLREQDEFRDWNPRGIGNRYNRS